MTGPFFFFISLTNSYLLSKALIPRTSRTFIDYIYVLTKINRSKYLRKTTIDDIQEERREAAKEVLLLMAGP